MNWRISNILMIIMIENFWKVSKSRSFLTKFLNLFLQKNMLFVHYAKFSLKITLNTSILQFTQSMRNSLITLKSISSSLKWERLNNFDQRHLTEKTLKLLSLKWQNLFLEAIVYHKWLKATQIQQQHPRYPITKISPMFRALKTCQTQFLLENEDIHFQERPITRKLLQRSQEKCWQI